MPEPKVIAWCSACENIVYEADDLDHGMECPECGETLLAWRRMDAGQRAVVKLHEWLRRVKDEGLGGPSPGGACQALGCSRSMVDNLVDAGLLERTDYDDDGHKVVMISSRSIRQVKASKTKHGKWTEAVDQGSE